MTLDAIFDEYSKMMDMEADRIIEYIYENSIYHSELFDSPIEFAVEKKTERTDLPIVLKGRCGIYIFVITDDIYLSVDDVRKWNYINKGASFKRENNMDITCGDILYVGKTSSKSLYVRLREHIEDGDLAALHLKNPKRQVMLSRVSVFLFPMKKKYELYYAMALGRIEKTLHYGLQPIAGSSKT